MGDTKLYDIYDSLEKISIYPLASGYYLLLALLIIALVILFYCKKYQKKNLWKRKLATKLHNFSKEKEVNISEIQQLIKEILVKKYNRPQIANLTGGELLEFLEKNDVNNFSWKLHGGFLLDIYSKNSHKIKSVEIQPIIKALKSWL
jgi:hypothetical protein